ncbi:uncharacterized protein PRCAT00001304001 [Priceomyces carsonii]|uniref:uncharacterized protein n=1 Tax=Priceomyces carsonii TaxID=28549 RepID=UPI002ED8E331|nr:unnamed protein product [Priceomyces carsonii]
MELLKTSYINTDIDPFYVGGTSATLSGDGSLLATPVLEDVVITNLETNEVFEKIEGDETLVTSLVMTLDGENLAIQSQSQQLKIYNLIQRKIIKTFKMSSPVYICATDKTSSLFAFGGSDGIITVWDIEGSYVTHSLKGHSTTVCSLTFYGDYNSTDWKLASGDIMGTVKIWDLVKRKCISTINEHNSAVRGVGFNKEGDRFISGGRDSVAIIYDTKKFRALSTFPINEQIESCGFISYQDKEFFYTAGSENVFRLFDILTGNLVASSPAPFRTNEELMIIDVKILDDDEIYLVISDQTLVKLDMNVEQTDAVSEFPIVKRLAGNHGTIVDLRYVGPHQNLIALATNSPSLRIVDPQRPFEMKIYEGHKDLLNALDASEDGRWIATASKDHEAKLWKWDEGIGDFVLYATFQGHVSSVTALSLSKSQEIPSYLITGSNDYTVKKWRIPLTQGSSVKVSEYTRRAHDKDINSIDVAPNDEFFATASYDKVGKIWNFDTGETIAILSGHKRGLWDINFCKYDKLVVTGSGDKSIKIWSLTDFTCKKTLIGHTNAIQRVKFFNRNLQVLSTGADGLIKLWDIKQEENVQTLANHNNRIWSLETKNDGEEFATGDADGQLSIWKDNSEEKYLREQQERELKIEQEQNLNNMMGSGDWSNAFLLALTLNHPMKLYNILKQTIAMKQDEESVIGSKRLEETISMLDEEQLFLLFKKIRDWNVNFKLFEIGQKVVKVILDNFEADKLINIPGLMKIIDSIIPYNERHYNRINDLLEQSFILNYTVDEMNKIIA